MTDGQSFTRRWRRRARAGRTVARDNEELLLSGRLVDDDVRVDGDDLVLGVERVVLLELEISDGSRESEISCRRGREGDQVLLS